MAGSRRPSTSRLTPFRTTIRMQRTLCNQRVEGPAHGVVLQLDADAGLSWPVEQNELRSAVDRLLVSCEGGPRRVAVDPHGLWAENVLDRTHLLLEAGEPERREEPEGDRLPVREREAGGGLEGVRERVTEVELGALSPLDRVTEADRRLERRRPTDLLTELELPDRLPRQEAGLDDLGTSVLDLLSRQRREELGVDDHLRRPVECARQVLATLDVDRRLAADRRVHLTDEGRRDRDPVDAAEEGRRDEAGEIARGAASERDDRLTSLEPQRRPQSLCLRGRLRALARRDRVRGSEPLAERCPHHVAVQGVDARVHDESDAPLARHEPRQALARALPDVHAGRSEDRAVQIARVRVRHAFVQ